MLTGHWRIQIARHLPEVVDVYVRDDRDIVALSIIRLRLDDGSEIAVYGVDTTKCLRSKLADDYSDRVNVLPIDPDLRERLLAVFGPMIFRDPE